MQFTLAVLTAVALAASPASASPAWAQPRPPDDPPPAGDPASETEGGMEPGVLPALVAAIPGSLVHGAGHWTAADPSTGWTLLAAEGAGLGLIGLGGLGLWLTRGSHEMGEPLYVLVGTGVGMFLVSWLSDIYGAATGGEGAGSPRAASPVVEASLGYRWVHDPQFDYSSFAVASADLRPGRFRISPSAWLALNDRNERWRLEGAVRLFGADVDGEQTWRGRGSRLDLELATTWHDYHDAGFAYLELEGALRGRLDLGGVSRSLRGSFAELGLGYGMQLFDYDVPGTGFGEDASALLLLRWAYGLYLGHGRARFGEVKVFYDHRRDGFVGGLGRPVLYGSIPGHVGLEGHAYFTPRWGVELELAHGSSFVAGASLRHRFGGDR